jgi:ABC-type dipeptide/oligopeptide/nickel transport system permease subunit
LNYLAILTVVNAIVCGMIFPAAAGRGENVFSTMMNIFNDIFQVCPLLFLYEAPGQLVCIISGYRHELRGR